MAAAGFGVDDENLLHKTKNTIIRVGEMRYIFAVRSQYKNVGQIDKLRVGGRGCQGRMWDPGVDGAALRG